MTGTGYELDIHLASLSPVWLLLIPALGLQLSLQVIIKWHAEDQGPRQATHPGTKFPASLFFLLDA